MEDQQDKEQTKVETEGGPTDEPPTNEKKDETTTTVATTETPSSEPSTFNDNDAKSVDDTSIEPPPVSANSVNISQAMERGPPPSAPTSLNLDPNNNTLQRPPAPPRTSSEISGVDGAREQVQKMVSSKELDASSASSLQAVFRENENLKEKVAKLKALLGRSAKAQRETKVELEATQKRIQEVLKENQKLKVKVEKLANRPTHMEMLADFETNFDRALLSVGSSATTSNTQQYHHHQQQQAGGQDTASAAVAAAAAMNKKSSTSSSSEAVMETLLMQELSEAKQRIEKLENLNKSQLQRTAHIENEALAYRKERDDLKHVISRLELEKRMAVMEAEQATKAMKEKSASLQEMQMEIDLLTKSSVKAQTRAAAGDELMKAMHADKQKIQELEHQVQALREWAVASNEAKTLAQERVRTLEKQLKRREKQLALHSSSKKLSESQRGDSTDDDNESVDLSESANPDERLLLSKEGSLVVGAGNIAYRVIELDEDLVKTVMLSERVVLRWHFELQNQSRDVAFSIMKGKCDTPAKQGKNADFLIQDRRVMGGAEGETEHAFSVQRACTISWSNKNSWVTPKTIKYSVEAVVLTH